jgi:hypothetical protein
MNFNNYKNPYDVLNLPINSSIEEVKRTYKKIALKSHPDKLNTITDTAEKNKKIKEFIDATNAYNSIINGDVSEFKFNFDNEEDYNYDDWIKTFNDIKNSTLLRDIIKSFINLKPKIRKHNINVDITYHNYFSNNKKKLRLFLKGLIEPVFINLDCKKYPIHIINYFDNNDNEHEITINMNLINDITINKGFYHLDSNDTDSNDTNDNHNDNNTNDNANDNDTNSINSGSGSGSENDSETEGNEFIKVNEKDDNKINIYYDMEIDTIEYIIGAERELIFINKEVLKIKIEPFSTSHTIKNKGIGGGDLIVLFKYIPIKKENWNKILDADKKEMVRIFEKLKNDIKI